MAKSDNNLTAVFTDIANAIRNKTGSTATMTPRDFADGVMAIETSSGGGTGIDTSDATATSNDILLDKTAYANGEKIIGTIPTYNNEHENGYVQISSLKKLLDAMQTTYHLFGGYNGTSVDDIISYSDTENVIDMESMFDGCLSLQSIPLLNTSNVTTMIAMFQNCPNLQTIPQLDTSNVTDMSGMFAGCSALQTIPQLDTSNVTDMFGMFAGCENLQSIPLLNTSNVTSIRETFYNCYLLPKIDITSMDKITTVSRSSQTFANCYSLTKLIIRTMTTIPVLNSNAFDGCYHFNGTVNATYNPDGLKDGRIYVPDDKVEELKAAPNWSAFADIIVPLSTLVE